MAEPIAARHRSIAQAPVAERRRDGSKPPVAPKPKLLGPVGLRLTSPLMPRACSAPAKGPKPAVAPKPKALPDCDTRDLVDNTSWEACVNGGSLPLDEELNREKEPQCYVDEEGEAKAIVEQRLGLCDIRPGQEDSGKALRELDSGEVSAKGTREDDMMQDSDEDWRLTDASTLRDTVGSSDAGLTTGSTNGMEMTDTDMTEDMNSEGCDAGEALADTDGFSVGDCSFASVEEEEMGCPAVKGPALRDIQKRKETLEDGKEDNAVYYTTDLAFTGSLTKSPTIGQQELLKVREEQDMGLANGHGVISNVLNTECSHGILKRAGHLKPCQKQGSHVFLEAKTKPEPNYISSEDVIDGRQILIDHKVAMLSKSPLIQHKHLLGDSTVVLPSKYRCITNKDSPFRKCIPDDPRDFASSEDNLDMDDGIVGDKDKERITTRQNRINVKSEDHTTRLLNASLDRCPRFTLVSFSMPTDLDTSLTSSMSESQLTSPDDSYVLRDEDDIEGHIVPFLDDTTDTEQDLSEEHVYEEAGQDPEGEFVLSLEKRSAIPGSLPLSRKLSHYLGRDQATPTLTSSPMLNTVRAKCYSKPHRLSHYPRSYSVEGKDMPLHLCREREGPSRERGENGLFLSYAFGSSGSFSRCPPRPCSGLSTPTSMLDIPPPFELACITKRPITKSSPSLLMDGDLFEKNKKKKSSIKRFLMLKFKKKSDSKPAMDLNSPTSRSSSESINHITNRSLEMDKNNLSNFSQFNVCPAGSPRSLSKHLSTFASYSKQNERSLAFLNRSVIRVESFEDRSRVPFVALPLTKPRSISFPNTDTSDYENIPPLSSDYENVQVRHLRPIRQETFPEFFDRPCRARSTANDTDGYVDMSSFPGFERRTRTPPEETESAYTEAYKVCSMAVPRPTAGPAGGGGAEGQDQGHTSEEEDRGADSNYDRPPDGRSRAFYIAKELMDTERLHVKALKHLQEDFRQAVGAAVGDDGERVLDDERLREILNELPDVYTLHRRILDEDESQRIADVILSKKAEFFVFTTFIGHYDRSMGLLEDSCRSAPAFAAVVSQFEQSAACEGVSLKHQLLRVIVRLAQYRMLLTDYLNNLRPDSKEYEDTQAAVAVVSDIADQANDSLKHGENMLRLVNIEYSVRGQRDLLQPGRVFIKEGTLMKQLAPVSSQLQDKPMDQPVSSQPGGCWCPIHPLMNDILLYTYPQQDGKYRLKNTLSLTGMKVTKPSSEDTLNALQIEVTDISITLSASSSSEREDWFYTLSRGVMEHARGPSVYTSFLGEVMMCMNCTCDFSLTLRRHHCHACGRNIHPPNLWRHRKGTASFTQVTVCEEGAISGSLQRSKRSKHHWKRLWFLLKDKVLYTYRAQELPDRQERVEEANMFRLYHKKTLYYTFKAEDNCTAQR
ncbi:hypothetical protein NHX12_030475 [Muraenolepis orangiensis]|uniref:Uncharacterized protein n=1 Tax=Muraenolepis orangiensis TaxID=630683 RepID=A0A9Q0IMW0_9TELE|nr:hypothetical protein NHX12_030475 [Muraenolepis orangiensis]